MERKMSGPMACRTRLGPGGRTSQATRRVSTFPSILAQYISSPPPQKKVHWCWREGRGQRSSRKIVENQDTLGTLLERRGRSEMRSLKIASVARQQMVVYELYMQSLQEKVARQREEIRLRAVELENRLVEAEEQKRRARRLRRSYMQMPVHDPEHYKRFPKTRFGKVVLQEDSLRQKGILRCQEDVDKFWRTKLKLIEPAVRAEYERAEWGYTSST